MGRAPMQETRLSSRPPTKQPALASLSANRGHLTLPRLFQGLSSRSKWMETTQKRETGSKNEGAPKELSTREGRVGREQVSELSPWWVSRAESPQSAQGPHTWHQVSTLAPRVCPATPGNHPASPPRPLPREGRAGEGPDCGVRGMADGAPREAVAGSTMPLTEGWEESLDAGGLSGFTSQLGEVPKYPSGPSKDAHPSTVIGSN